MIVLEYPIKLSPCFKDYLWGGDGLKRLFGKQSSMEVTAESWELSCHENGQCTVAEGSHKGIKLIDFLRTDWEKYVGTNIKTENFPILVKFIDANKDLSIQVHPSDDAADKSLGERGKAEMWYIVDCKPQSHIYYGFSKKITRDEFIERAKNGTICEVLNRVDVQKGDIFYILPGTVHALGAGIIAAEIQQNSDTTFRIYDYKRLDKDGKPRPLHLERASEVVSYDPVVPHEMKINCQVFLKDFTFSKIFESKYFKAFKLDVKTKAALRCDGTSFHYFLSVEGEGIIKHTGNTYYFGRGDSYFLPACLGEYEIHGECRLLLAHL